MELTFETVHTREAALFHLYTAVRTEELRLQGWDPAERDRLLQFQYEAQRRGYRDQFPDADERLILRAGAPIGWIIVNRSPTELYGVDMALLPAERCKGIGTQVIRALQEEAAAEGRPMVIRVQRLNTRARDLYIRLGFRVISETDLDTLMEWRR